MASEQFSLCWDNFHRNMSSGLHNLLESEDLVDVTIAIDGQYLKAHKMVLSVCSPYFRVLFSMNPCQHPIIFMKDVSYSVMSDLLTFMYQGEVHVNQENLATFIKTAEALQIKGLTGDQSEDKSPSDTKPIKRPAPEEHRVEKTVKKPPVPVIKRPRVDPPPPPLIALDPEPPAPIVKSDLLPIPQQPVTSAAPESDDLIFMKMEPYDNMVDESQMDDMSHDNTDDNMYDSQADESDYRVGENDELKAGPSTDAGAGSQDGVPLFGKKSRSLSWEHFTRLDENTAKCLHCHRIIKSGNATSNLLKHMRRIHSEIFIK